VIVDDRPFDEVTLRPQDARVPGVIWADPEDSPFPEQRRTTTAIPCHQGIADLLRAAPAHQPRRPVCPWHLLAGFLTGCLLTWLIIA